MTAPRDPDQLIHAFLDEGLNELPDPVYDAVRDRIEQTRQRASVGLWRTALMGKILQYGLVAAAGALVAIIGFQALSTGPAPGSSASAEPSDAPTSVAPSSSGDRSLPVGPHVMVSRVGLNEDRVTVTIPAAGWFAEPDEGSLTKDLGGDDLVTVVTVPGDHYRVPMDICNWRQSTDLDPGYRMAETVDQLLAYLAEQTYDTPDSSLTRELSTPVEITIDGHPGQLITGVVPAFPDGDPNRCDEQRFCSLKDRDGGQCLLPHSEPGALVSLWISAPAGRNPALWVVAASYLPTTRTDLLDEMNAIVDSMTIIVE